MKNKILVALSTVTLTACGTTETEKAATAKSVGESSVLAAPIEKTRIPQTLTERLAEKGLLKRAATTQGHMCEGDGGQCDTSGK